MTLDFSFLFELSHQSRTAQSSSQSPSGDSTEGVPRPGKLGFGVIFWENSSGMQSRCVWMGKGLWDGRNTGITQTLQGFCLKWARAQPCPPELSAPHSSPGCWNPTPLPLHDSQWWHIRLLSELIISGPLFCSHCYICCSIKFSCVFFAGCHRILCPCW